MLLVLSRENFILPTHCSTHEDCPGSLREHQVILKVACKGTAHGSAAPTPTSPAHLCIPISGSQRGPAPFHLSATEHVIPSAWCVLSSALCLVNLSSSRLSSSNSSLWGSAPFPLPPSGSVVSNLHGVTWTSGIPGRQHLLGTAMVCLLSQLDDHPLVLEEEISSRSVYSAMHNRRCRTHFVFRKLLFVKGKGKSRV